MRKRLCLMMTAALLFSSMLHGGIGAYADNSKIIMHNAAAEKTEYADAAGYLRVLEAADFSEEELESEASRQEFAKAVCVIGGCVTGFKQDIFSDVDYGSEYSQYINALAENKIISSGGEFEPERTVTVQEAATMLVRVLGYAYRAERGGEYPHGYMAEAAELDLFKNVDIAKPVSKGAAAQMCVNALDTEIMRAAMYSDDTEYRATEGYTLAWHTFSIVHIKDIVDAVDITALKGSNPTGPYHISIGGIMMDAGDLDTRGFLGYEADAYCYAGDMGSEPVLKWINATKRNTQTVIAVDDITEIENGTVRYYDENNRQRSCRFNVMAPVIYNGAATSEPFTYDLISPYEGSIRLLDNNGDGRTDVIFAEVYSDCVVDGVNIGDKKIYDRYDNKEPLSADTESDDPFVIIYDSSGEEVFLNDIKKDDVLSVYQSRSDADQMYTEIHLSSAKVSGMLESVYESENKIYVTVGGEEYRLTKGCAARCGSRLKAGSAVELLIDIHGCAAGVNFDSTQMMFGYIKTVGMGEEPDKTVWFRIFNEDGEFESRTAEEKFKIDGVTYENSSSEILTVLEAASSLIYPAPRTDLSAHCYAQPIRYRLNDLGEIKYIDTVLKSHNPNIQGTSADAEGDNALYKWYNMTAAEKSDGGLRYRESGCMLGGRFLITDDTKFLTYPSPEDTAVNYLDEDKYTIVTKKYFVGTLYYQADSYNCTENNLKSDFLLIKSSQGAPISSEEHIAVVERVETVYENDEIMKKVVVMGEAGETGILCRDGFTFNRVSATSANPDIEASELPLTLTANDLHEGDVIRYLLTPSGYADNIELYYRICDGYIVNNTTYANSELRMIAMNSFTIRYGYVMKKQEEGFSIWRSNGFSSDADLAEAAGAGDGAYEIVPNYAYCTYIIYDSNESKKKFRITAGSYNDIAAYKNVGDECSRVIVQTSGATPSVVIIVK